MPLQYGMNSGISPNSKATLVRITLANKEKIVKIYRQVFFVLSNICSNLKTDL